MSSSDSSARACWAAISACASSSSGREPSSWDRDVWLADASDAIASHPANTTSRTVAPTSPRLNVRLVLRVSHSCAHTSVPSAAMTSAAAAHGNAAAPSRDSVSCASAFSWSVCAEGSISWRMSVEACSWYVAPTGSPRRLNVRADSTRPVYTGRRALSWATSSTSSACSTSPAAVASATVASRSAVRYASFIDSEGVPAVRYEDAAVASACESAWYSWSAATERRPDWLVVSSMTADFARIEVMPVTPAPRMRTARTARTPRSWPGVCRSAAATRSVHRPGAAPGAGGPAAGGAWVGAGGDWTAKTAAPQLEDDCRDCAARTEP